MMSIMDSGVVYQKLVPPQELQNPVEGQPLTAALRYIFDHTGFTGELLKVLEYAIGLAVRYEDEGGQIIATPSENANGFGPPRALPQAERSYSDPGGLQLPRGVNPFQNNGVTTSDRLIAPIEKQTLPANPDPVFDPSAPVPVIESGGNATDPGLVDEIVKLNKVSPAERFKIKPNDPF